MLEMLLRMEDVDGCPRYGNDCLFHYSLKGVLLARLAKESKKWFFASAFSICSA